MHTVQIETNSVARKGRTSARDRAATSKPARSSTNTRKGAGGQVDCEVLGATAASKVARKGGKASTSAQTTMTAPSQNSRTGGASGHALGENHDPTATRTISAATRKTSSRASVKDGKNSPRAIEVAESMTSPRAATNSDGHLPPDPQDRRAVAPSSALHSSNDIQRSIWRATSQASLPLPGSQREAIGVIYSTWRQRQGVIKAMTKLSLQAQATLRSGREREEAAKHYGVVAKDMTHPDYLIIAPYLEAQEPLAKYRGNYEKELARQVRTLPIYEWAKGVSGLGDVSLAGLIGECSGYNFETAELWSIGQMKSPSAMWKRLGLAVMSGIRQGDATAGLSKADWVEHGYVKTRRSVVWNVGECIVKAQWRKENTVHAYGKFYGEEKARLQALNEAGEYAEQATHIVERMKKAGSKPLAENLAGRLTAGHINNRAKRHMTKRLIRDLWLAWRAADRKAMGLPPDGYVPVAEAA